MGLRAEIHFQTASLSLSLSRHGARDRDSLIGFRARARCLSTHSVTEAVYRKFKLFCRTRSRRRNGCRLASVGAESDFLVKRTRFARALYAFLSPLSLPPFGWKINVPRPGTIFRGRIRSEIGGFSRRIFAS